jgi:NADPH-dependent 2,4-dienoyl-CoA reductase/sulfur reductase-like enzyme
MKVVIVGGVAGGASCAARLRRLDEQAEIVMVERGPYVSYANCGLPYHVGGVIEEEASLLVADVATFRGQFAIDARTGCEAVAISPTEKTVQLRDVASGELRSEPYDKLVLSPGAASIRPPLPELRNRLGELPRDREIHVVCRSGQRAYYATRILLQHGFMARTVAGGMRSLAHQQLLDAPAKR